MGGWVPVPTLHGQPWGAALGGREGALNPCQHNPTGLQLPPPASQRSTELLTGSPSPEFPLQSPLPHPPSPSPRSVSPLSMALLRASLLRFIFSSSGTCSPERGSYSSSCRWQRGGQAA